MFQISKKQYIFRTSSGQVQNIFYKADSGIYSSFLRGKNSWTEAAAVIKGTTPDFSACIDDNNIIHILCRNTGGDIYHIYSGNGSWNTDEVLKIRHPEFNIKHFYITSFDSRIFYFYVLEEKENKMLVFQTQDKKNVLSAPELVTLVRTGANLPYRLLKYKNTLLVFYNSADKNDKGISYRTYIQSENKWSPPIDITSEYKNQEHGILSVASDYKENIHVSWQKASPLKYEFVYSRKSPSEELWNEEILAASPYSFNNSSILTIDNKVIAYWVRDKKINYCISEDSGGKWAGPKKYYFYPNKPLYCISYAENTGIGAARNCFSELPGNFLSGYILGFIDYFSSRKGGNENVDELQAMIINTLKMISSSIEDIKKSVEDLNQRLDKLELKQKKGKVQFNSLVSNPMIEEPENESKPEIDNFDTKKTVPNNISVLPGTGFANITPEYLRNMNKRP